MASHKYKICIIVPYFGVLPDKFHLWLKGAEWNREIDFHLVGDCFDLAQIPTNIFVHHQSFRDLNRIIEEKLGGRQLASPYKLCDLKPTYAALFPGIVDGYDIWGFSDLDVLYGDISALIDFGTIPENWGRVFDLGHLSFFPNKLEINRIFETRFLGKDIWPFVRDSRIVWVFDEHYSQGLGGVNERLLLGGYQVLSLRHLFSDVVPQFCGFVDREMGSSANLFFMWAEGKIWRIFKKQDEVCKEETSYVHLQKRDFQVQSADSKILFLTPDYWGDVKTLEQGVHLLDVNAREDIHLCTPRNNIALRKVKKWSKFCLEVFMVKSGFAAFGILLKAFWGVRSPGSHT